MESHIIPLFINRAATYGDREVFRYKGSEGHYSSITWKALKNKTESILSGLTLAGVEKGAMVGIFSRNKPEWMMVDLAIMAHGSVVVPFYATAARDQLEYIISETQMELVFAGDKEQLHTILDLMDNLPTLKKVVCFTEDVPDDPRVVTFTDFLNEGDKNPKKLLLEELERKLSSDELATVIYTSGTTGEPKGVMLKQSNFMECFRIHDTRLNVEEKDVSMCFLPLSHIFERMWSHYLLHKGAVNVFLENPKTVIETLPIVKPSLMCTVPRFFDKTYAGILEEAARWPAIKRKVFHWAINKGLMMIAYKSKGKSAPRGLSMKYKLAEILVLKKLRSIFGGNIKFMPCAGAAINTEILKFFHAAGLFVNYGYGLTETTATVSCFRDDEYHFGTCGTIMPDTQVKIKTENNEILVKGGIVFHGYYKKEEETKKVLQDGWFATGDEGYVDDHNNLIMVDRIKDLMKTSVGKYISPQKLELILSKDKLVEQLIVVGDNRKFVSALVVPEMERLKKFAAENNIDYTDDENLVQSEYLLQLMQQRFDDLQKSITPYEKVVKFTLLPQPFTIEGGTMTSTLKLRRSAIERLYKAEVDAMYADTD